VNVTPAFTEGLTSAKQPPLANQIPVEELKIAAQENRPANEEKKSAPEEKRTAAGTSYGSE
jgi:hypothetical protein